MVEPPRPAPDEMTAFFWEGCLRGELWILRCDSCGRFIHWPRPVCSGCLSTSLSPALVSGRGTLYSFTVARQAFHPWFQARLPYVIATVALEEQADLRMVTNMLDDVSSLEVDMPVEVAFTEVAEGLVLPMFRAVP